MGKLYDISQMHSYLRYAADNLDAILHDIAALASVESPSGHAAGIDEVCRRLTHFNVPRIGFDEYPSPVGRHLRLDFGPKSREGRLLVMGHSDTVWPVGTLAHMPCRLAGERFHGPGVLDMKGGLIAFLWAIRLLDALGEPLRRPVSLLVVADEETGSQHSRAITEAEARSSETALVLEPGTGLTGKLKTARKGIARYVLTVRGIAAHAGVDFAAGASAVLELARQIERVATLTDIDGGITVNPGVIAGGTASNVVAAEASCELDVRAWTAADADAVHTRLQALAPVDNRCTLTVSGGLNRPPMERTSAIAGLFSRAAAIASALGLTVEESSTGGGSDGNFTAALGIPTLDGLGLVGEGAHAVHENVVVEEIPRRVALLAALMQRL